MKGLSILIATLALAACASHEKTVETPTNKSETASVSRAATREDVVAKYSIVELDAAANLLKVVIDESGGKLNDDKGTDVVGCPLTGKQATTMTMPVKSLIDQQMKSESESYQTDPKNYAIEKGFETCAATCSCGVLSDVVNGADETALPPGSSGRLQARNKQRLSMKASHQTARDSLSCARKQSWFCGSDLKAYLEKEAKSNAE